ncbi:cytochrome P450 [Colletotrichum somersetense]|nr:cytochrome P450 [Colletotrichum somersetense]
MRDYAAYASVAVSVVVIYSIASVIRQYVRLQHIKGPPGSGFTKWWLLRAVYGGRMHLDFYDAYKKYGPLVRVGPRDLVTSDPDLMKRMLDNVLSTRDNALHAELRSKMAAGYLGKKVENLKAKVDKNILQLINLVYSYVSEDKPFDFGLKAQYFTLDVITDLAFSKPFGDLASDSDVYEYIHTAEKNMPNVVVTAVLPWLLALLSSPLFRCLLPSDKDAIGLRKTIRIAKEVAAKRFGPNKKIKKDMLGSFIAHTYVTRALCAEIESVKPSWPVIKEKEARGMPYLQAVIKEGLHIFPPVVGQMSKEVPKGGDTFKGVYLPEGTRISYGVWAIFHQTDLWGPDAHEFRPERWLEAETEELEAETEELEAETEELKRMEGMLELVFGNYGIFLQLRFWIQGYKLDA